jgi:hypothetical protein
MPLFFSAEDLFFQRSSNSLEGVPGKDVRTFEEP